MKKKDIWKWGLGLLGVFVVGLFCWINFSPSQAIRMAIKKHQLEDRILQYNQRMTELEAWQAVNSEVALILKFEDEEKTRIIPVVYTAEDRDKYYRMDVYGNYDPMGTTFVDDNSTLDSQNLIINGHSSKTKDQQFTFLKQLADSKYFEAHEFISLMDKEGIHQFKIVLIAEFDLALNREKELYGDWYNGSFRTLEEARQMLETMRELAICQREIVYQDENILTLITCNMAKEDSRYVVMAVETNTDDMKVDYKEKE